MKLEDMENKFKWLIDVLENEYGKENVKTGMIDCDTQFGIAVKLKNGTRTSIRIYPE